MTQMFNSLENSDTVRDIWKGKVPGFLDKPWSMSLASVLQNIHT